MPLPVSAPVSQSRSGIMYFSSGGGSEEPPNSPINPVTSGMIPSPPPSADVAKEKISPPFPPDPLEEFRYTAYVVGEVYARLPASSETLITFGSLAVCPLEGAPFDWPPPAAISPACCTNASSVTPILDLNKLV